MGHSLLVLTWIIRITMIPSLDPAGMILGNTQRNITKVDMQSWIRRIQTNSNAPQDSSKDMMVKMKVERVEPFWTNMRSKVPFHLVQIIHLLEHESSLSVNRIAVDCFCRCILVDTYESWIGGKSKLIQDHDVTGTGLDDISWIDTIKEYCLTMMMCTKGMCKCIFFSLRL